MKKVMKKKTAKVAELISTEIAVVIDESGSMASVTNDVIGGFNTFISDQKKLKGECNLTLTKFNTRAEVVYEGVSIKEVPELTRETYTPGGSTALFDAIVKSIKGIKDRLAKNGSAVPKSRVLILVMTDGEENASRECHSKSDLKKIVDEVTKNDKYEFMYIGANQDAFAAGSSMGIGRTINYTADSKGTQSAYRSMSQVACCYRSTGTIA
jgi:Mg-chelatase subunit ChlD